MTIVNGVHHFSNTEITTFQQCPRKWWLIWYRGLTPRLREVQGPRSTGTRLHIALAALYSLPAIYSENCSAAAPSSRAQNALDLVQAEDLVRLHVQYEFDEDLEMRVAKIKSDFDLERIMLEGYLEWIQETGIDKDLEVIGVEQYLEVDYPYSNIEKVKLIGKIDSRVRSRITGRRKFIDHKTVQSVRDATLNMNRQMLHYHLLEDLTTPEDEPRSDGALYNMLRKVKRTRASKPPYYARVPIEHNRHQILSYQLQLDTLIGEILHAHYALAEASYRATEIMPANVGRHCTWCPFMKVCTMFDDGSRVEAALEDLYQVQDPLSYYGAREKEGEYEQTQ